MRIDGDNAGCRGEAPAAGDPPRPGSAFRWARETWGLGLRCVPLEHIADHAFTSRQLTLPRTLAPNGPDVWTDVAAASGVPASRLMRVKQVHGRAVRVVREADVAAGASMARPEADAVASDVPGVALLVQVADCVPILLADTTAGAAAAVHAGWRGTCAGIAGATVATLVDALGCRPDRLVAAIGPSIGPDDYEVGDAVRDAFIAGGHGTAVDRWFRRDAAEGRLRLDLGRANRDQLVSAGVPAEAIHDVALSTYRHPDWLDSYRRDGASAGRMAAFIVVPGPSR